MKLDTILVFLSLLGYYFILLRYLKASSENCLFLLMSSLILIMYWLAYANILFWGTYVILGVGWVGLLLVIPILRADKEILWQQYFTPVFVFTILYIIFLSLLSIGLHVNSVDEFSHWGPHAEYLWLNHGFIRAQDIVVHKSYPPGSALFYYLFYALGGFSETKTFIAQQLLVLTAVPVALKNIRWKDWPLAFLGYSFLLLILNLLGVRLGLDGSLYMDPMVGIFFGAIIVCYRLSPRKSINILALLLPIFALSLFKLKLLPFVGVVTLIILVDQLLQTLYNYRDNAYSGVVAALKLNSKLIITRFCCILAVPFAALVAIKSWSFYLTKIQIPKEWATHFSSTKLFNLLTGQHLTQQELITLTNFKHILSTPIIFAVAVIILAIITGILLKRRREGVAIFIDNLILLLGFCGFLFGLLLMYIFNFGAYEGEGLAAFDRYVAIYYIAWSIVVYAGLFQALLPYKFIKSRKLQFPLIIIMLAALAFMIIGHYHRMHKPDQIKRSRWQFRQGIQTITNAIKSYTANNARIFVVWQSSSGYSAKVIGYELIPRTISLTSTSFGVPYTSGDVWTANWPLSKLASYIKSYDYLLLAYTDQKFWHTYGALFAQKPPQLKPLVNYQVCVANEFDGMRAKGCQMRTEQAYLLKIMSRNGQLYFQNVK